MYLNPTDTLTWFHLTIEDRASTIDLAFTNKATLFTRQLRDVSVSDGLVLLSDHTMLSLPFYSLMSLTLIPPPIPKGYNTDLE